MLPNAKFLAVEGEIDANDNMAKFVDEYENANEGSTDRWFGDQPMVSEGSTWLLSNQWGRETEALLAALTQTVRGLVSEVPLTMVDGVPSDCVINLDNIHTIPRETLRRKVALLSPVRMAEACRALQASTGC